MKYPWIADGEAPTHAMTWGGRPEGAAGRLASSGVSLKPRSPGPSGVALHRFAPASPEEPIVHGAAAPGGVAGGDADVEPWIEAIRGRGIERVVCLLSDRQLRRYHALLDAYRGEFGTDAVTHVSMTDHQLAESGELERALAAFGDAEAAGEPVVAHCLAGIGRTGQAMAAWLVSARGFAPEPAIETVRAAGRDPAEAVRSGDGSEAELLERLAALDPDGRERDADGPR